jgi:putative tricarboxylic transport membrane protein
MLDNVIIGFGISISWSNLLFALIGTVLGTVVGFCRGLAPGLQCLTSPLTFRLDVTSAIIMLCGIYYGVAYSGTSPPF